MSVRNSLLTLYNLAALYLQYISDLTASVNATMNYIQKMHLSLY